MDPTPSGRLTDPARIRSFILAGHAIFTIRSLRTGDHRTFLVERAPPNPRYSRPGYFARLLVGPENTSDYRYVGFVHHGEGDTLALKTRDEARAAGLRWLLGALNAGGAGLEQAEVWHAGRCGRCGRLLTDPDSIASGIGPTCAGRAA